jgi:hypothetical protein
MDLGTESVVNGPEKGVEKESFFPGHRIKKTTLHDPLPEIPGGDRIWVAIPFQTCCFGYL